MVNSLLGAAGIEGSVIVTAMRKAKGSPHYRGELRIGIFNHRGRYVKVTHQMSDNDSRYEFSVSTPSVMSVEDFYSKLIKAAPSVNKVKTGTKGSSTSVLSVEKATPPTEVPPIEAAAPEPASKFGDAKGFTKNLDQVKAFMQLLAVEADSKTGQVSKDTISLMFMNLFGVNRFTAGQLIRRLKEMGEIELIEEGLFRIVKFAELRPVVAVLAAVASSVQTVPAPEPRRSISTSVSGDLDALVQSLSRQYLDALSMTREVSEETEKVEKQIADLGAKLAKLKDQQKMLEEILKPGGVHHTAARQSGAMDPTS